MVSKKIVAAAAVASVGANAQASAVVTSILGQISNGIVAARKSGVNSEQAGSEVAEIMTALNANTDISNLVNSAANMVLGGISSDGVIKLIDGAKTSLAAWKESDDYNTVYSLFGKYASDLNTDVVVASVSSNLSPVLALVIPPISSLSASDQTVASSVNMAVTDVSALYSTLINASASGSASASASASATASATATATGSESASASGSASESASKSSSESASKSASESSSASASSTASKSSSAQASSNVTASSTPATTSSTQNNGQSKLQAGAIVVGIAAAGALLL